MGIRAFHVLLCLTWAVRQFCVVRASSNFTQLYHEARMHYLDEQWRDAVDAFEELLIKWRTFHRNLLSCRRDCMTRTSSEANENIAAIRVASCQLDCRPYLVCDKTVKNDLRRNMPYNYLQLAYYKLNDLERAAASAYTYYLKNMEDEVASSNVKHFRSMPGIHESYFRDREVSFHVDVLKSAPDLYARSDDKEQLLGRLLGGLDDLLDDLDSCLTGCQKPVDISAEFEEDDGDLTSNLGIHLSQFINCTIFCEDTVSTIDGEKNGDYLLIYLLNLHSVAGEAGNQDIYSRVLSSISLLGLSEEVLQNVNIPLEALAQTDSLPFLNLKRYISRQKETSFLSDLLTSLLSEETMA